MGIIVAGVVAFMAFESYTLDINAHLEPVLSVNPHGDWDMGTVYPETERFTKLFVGLSNSAKDDPNFIAVQYTISCQQKPLALRETGPGLAVLSGAFVIVRNLCPNITVTEQVTGVIVVCLEAPVPCDAAIRTLTLASQPDAWDINIRFPDCIGAHQKEPLVKEIDCGFDPATGKFAGVNLGAQIAVQVLNIDQAEKCITDKQGQELPDCVKLPPTPTPEAPTITATPEEPTATATPTPTPELPDLQATFDSFTEGGTGGLSQLRAAAIVDPFSCEIHFTITNVKTADAGASTTRVKVTDSVDVATPPIAGGASFSGSATFPDPCFDPVLGGSIKADFFDDVEENDETNNVFDFDVFPD